MSPRAPERTAEFLERLRAALTRLGCADGPGRFAVAFSGGVDSSVLLAAMAQLYPAAKLRALHVDHGLHADSRTWAEQAAAFARGLGVDYACRRVEVRAERGESLEAVAREQRYRALAGMIEPGDAVLTAHQADDQLETLLQRLFRGSGVRGLRGVLEVADFPPGVLLRPLLTFTRAEIRAEAERRGLTWVEDPANRALNFDRSFVRAKVLPVVLERWPAAPAAAVRLARQMSEAEALLDALAAQDTGPSVDLARLSCARLRALEGPRQSNLLRFAIRALDLPMPSARQLAELEGIAASVGTDTKAKVAWPGAEARFYRDHVYLMRPLAAFAPQPMQLTKAHDARGEHGSLRLIESTEAGLPDAWARAGIEIRFRRGGERFTPLGATHSRALKTWFQETGIVPWMRARVPLLYHDGELVAIADLALGDAARAVASSGPRWRVAWTEHPRVS